MSAGPADLLQPLRDEPSSSAVLSDVDGTLAPIVREPGDAEVLTAARDVLARIAGRYAVVACVSGRPAEDARRLVGVEGVTYLGNHGLERLDPGASVARLAAALEGHEKDAARFLAGLGDGRVSSAGLRVEDKGPIRALHWRGAEDEPAAERAAKEIAAEAEQAGLATHRGRKVLELRPPVRFDKGVAIGELLDDHPVRNALYAGDDRTDLDAFRALRERATAGALDTAVCVAIGSDEAPAEVSAEGDIIVPDPPSFATLLSELA